MFLLGVQRLTMDADRLHKDVSVKSIGYTYVLKKDEEDTKPKQHARGILTDFDIYDREDMEELHRKVFVNHFISSFWYEIVCRIALLTCSRKLLKSRRTWSKLRKRLTMQLHDCVHCAATQVKFRSELGYHVARHLYFF